MDDNKNQSKSDVSVIDVAKHLSAAPVVGICLSCIAFGVDAIIDMIKDNR